MTLTIRGPVRILIVNMLPKDRVVGTFIDEFLKALHHSSSHHVCTLSPTKWDDLYNGLKAAPGQWNYNTLLFVTHGDNDGEPAIEDPVLNKLPSGQSQPLHSWHTLPQWTQEAFDDRLIMLAVCNAGSVRNANAILRGALGMHMLTSKEGKPLHAVTGAKAMAAFINEITDVDATSMDELSLERAMDESERQFPGILSLWLYPGENPYP